MDEPPLPPPSAPSNVDTGPAQPVGPLDYGDGRLGVISSFGRYSKGSTSGSVHDGWSLAAEYVWSSGIPGFVWLIGLDLDLGHSDLITGNSILYTNAAHVGLGYGFPFSLNCQLELLPYVELVGVSIDHPYSNKTAWGDGGGIGGKAVLAYTFSSLAQLGVSGGYGVRWFNLNSSDVSTRLVSIGLSIGKRF